MDLGTTAVEGLAAGMAAILGCPPSKRLRTLDPVLERHTNTPSSARHAASKSDTSDKS